MFSLYIILIKIFLKYNRKLFAFPLKYLEHNLNFSSWQGYDTSYLLLCCTQGPVSVPLLKGIWKGCYDQIGLGITTYQILLKVIHNTN